MIHNNRIRDLFQENGPITGNHNDTKDSLYASTAQNSVHQYTDQSLIRTSECLRNFQEAERARTQQGRKSKVADMAEAANLSGNDIMGYNMTKTMTLIDVKTGYS